MEETLKDMKICQVGFVIIGIIKRIAVKMNQKKVFNRTKDKNRNLYRLKNQITQIKLRQSLLIKQELKKFI